MFLKYQKFRFFQQKRKTSVQTQAHKDSNTSDKWAANRTTLQTFSLTFLLPLYYFQNFVFVPRP